MRSSSYPSSVHLGLQPLPAWIAILGLIFVTSICTLAGVGSIVRLAFPLGSFVVGLFLYLRYPVLYIGFTWWLWFLAPWLRRVIDYRSGWDPQGLILIAPFLVTLITLVTLFQNFPKTHRQGGLPFVLAFVGVVYGFFIGLLINHPPIVVVRALLDWLTPILFGFHLFTRWRDYPKLRQNIQNTFFWCVLITGFYGVYQYLLAPGWDCFWIIETGLVTNGKPEPLGIRTFSTMNSPGPFANVMMAGLLLLFSSESALRAPAAIVGYLSLLLSVVRSAWGGWFLGLITLVTSLKARLQMRLIIGILVIAVCVFPLTTIEPFSSVINSRFASFSNIKEDTSFSDRSQNYDKNINLALSSGLGNGLGSIYHLNEKGVLELVVLDSGILDLFFTLGWFGAIPYIGGVVLLLFSLFQGIESSFDSFMAITRAISLGIFSQLVFGSTMLSLSGLILWGFLGIGMAGRKYYQHQRITRPKR